MSYWTLQLYGPKTRVLAGVMRLWHAPVCHPDPNNSFYLVLLNSEPKETDKYCLWRENSFTMRFVLFSLRDCEKSEANIYPVFSSTGNKNCKQNWSPHKMQK